MRWHEEEPATDLQNEVEERVRDKHILTVLLMIWNYT